MQTVSNRERKRIGLKPLGRGFTEANRLNPYHPFSYLTIAIVLIVGIFMFGFVGFWKQVDLRNPFKWD